MATSATSTHLPPLGTHVRDEVGRELQATLVELVDLSLVGKQLHWSVVGPHFAVLHEKLDELVDSWRELSDTVAERAVAIGFFPDGQADPVVADGDRTRSSAVRSRTTMSSATSPGGWPDVVERARTRIDRLGELDVASQDVLIEVLRELEKQLWMIRAQLPQGG